MTEYQNYWRHDLSNVSPKKLRLARLALNFCRATLDEKARLSIYSSANRAAQSLLLPLIDPEGQADLSKIADDLDDHDLDFLINDENKLHKREWDQILAAMPENLFENIRLVDQQDPFNEVPNLFCKVLDLDEVDRRLLLFVDLLCSSKPLRMLCREGGVENSQINSERLALLLETSAQAVRTALRPEGRLRQLALLKMSENADLEDFLQPGVILKQANEHSPRNETELLGVFVEELTPAQVGLDAFPHLVNQANRVRKVFEQALKIQEAGVNALFYGSAGTGKTELAKAIVSSMGYTAYNVRTSDANGNPLNREGRLGGYQMAQILLQGSQSKLLIFDEIEDLQGTDELMLSGLTGYAPSQDKGWFNRVLECNQVPTIWITNYLDSLDPAARRRFLLSIAFRTPPRAVRRDMAAGILAQTGVSDWLIDQVAADVLINPAALTNAQRVVRLCPDEEVNNLVINILADWRRTMHRQAAPRNRTVNTTIDLRLLNMEGANTPDAVVEGIRKSGQGRLCLFGKPGTGKTQFAEHLAEALDRELIVATASTVISPYVGVTERNLADLFEDADPGSAVILLDEVDSFLIDRRHAEHSWEKTQVNELLQQMERFPGVFIAATNLMDGLDAAAMRRFDLKLQFLPLTTEQRYRVFAQEALGNAEAAVPETSKRLLDNLKGLTLGDVANVQRQQKVLGEALSPEQFLNRLRAEWELKAKDE